MISPFIMIFIYGLAYYALYRAIRAENIVEGIVSGFLSSIISIVGIINTYDVGTVLIDNVGNIHNVKMISDTAPYILYPIVILGIILSILNVIQYVRGENYD